MNNKPRQITSDIAGRLKKIRSGVVYSSITSVISELLQNCQRDKAKNIFCQFQHDTLTITDDGVGCNNPDDLFTLDKSAWESTSEGFGEGFSSVYLVADYLEVHSRNWLVRMNIDNMIKNGDLAYQSEETSEYLKGFKVTISGAKLQENETELESFLKYAAALLPMDVYVNSEKILKADFADIPSETGLIKAFDNKLYTAYLTPVPWMDKITLFYESREVCKEYHSGAAGNIILKRNAVNLKAPDRRAIINDSKYQDFKEQVKKDIKILYKIFIQEATNELIDRYASPISEILEVKDYQDLLALTESMFNMYAPNDEAAENDCGIEKKLEPLKILKPKLDVFCTDTTRSKDNMANCSCFPTDSPTMEQVKTLAPRARKSTILAIIKSDKIFWVEAKYLQSYREAITTMEYYGMSATR
jgi:hypothetical protein